jgi:anti-sigma factor RsiW
VNRVPDQDLMLLESYLDDELSANEVEALRERLIEEPELADALVDLRAARAARQKVFGTMEPGELAVSDMVAKVQKTVRSRIRWNTRVRESLRYVAAAACVTIGVMVGSKATQPVSAPLSVGPSATAWRNDVTPNMSPIWNEPGPAMPVQFDTSLQPVQPRETPRVVVLRDGRGEIVAAFTLENANEASRFFNDLRNAASQGHQLVPAPQQGASPSPRGTMLISAPAAPDNVQPIGPSPVGADF